MLLLRLFFYNFLYDLPLLNKHILSITMYCNTHVVISKVSSKNFNEEKGM